MKRKKGKEEKEKKGWHYNINMILPFMFWKFFFHNFKVSWPYSVSILKRVLHQKSLQNHKIFEQDKMRPKMPLQTITFNNCNKTNKMQTLSKHNYMTLTTKKGSAIV